MSVANLGNNAERYYYEKDPIYNEQGNGENLNWRGAIAEEMGLSGKVSESDFKEVLNGRYKETELRDHSKITEENKDRAGYDLVFSASKSVSHSALVLGDKKVEDAFNDAVDKTLGYVETLAQERNYNKNGQRVKETTGKLLIAQARHSTARPVDGQVDPSLHSHNIIMNTTKDKDGNFKSLSSDAIFKNQNMIQEVFKSELAKNLKDAGYGISVDKKGNIEIAGYSKEIIDEFSNRKFEIARIKDELRKDDRYKDLSEKKLDLMAQHSFKSEKIDISREDLKEDWDKRTEKYISKDQLMKNISEEGKDLQRLDRLTASEGLKLAINFKTENEVIVKEDQLIKTALKIGRGDYTYEDVKNEISKIEKDRTSLNNRDLDSIVSLGERQNAKGQTEKYYTTVNIFENERKMLENISKGKQFEPIMSREDASKYLLKIEKDQKFDFSEDQRKAYYLVLNSKEQFITINGLPGTGKTTLFNGIRIAAEEHKGKEFAENLYTLLATTGKAASGAEEEAGLRASTVHSFLNNKGNLSEGSIKDIVNERLENIKGTKQSNDNDKNTVNNDKNENKNVSNPNKDKASEIEKQKDNKDNFVVSKFGEKNVYKDNSSDEIKHVRNSALEQRKGEVLNFREQNIAHLPTKAHTEGLREYGRDTHKGISVGLSGVFKHKHSFDGSKQTSWTDNTVEGRRTHIKQQGKIELKDPETKQNLGIVLDFEKKIEIQEKSASTSTKTDTKFSDGTKQKTISTTSNLFGKESSYGAKTLFGNDKRDKEGNRIFKQTISKKASDLLYKSEKFEHVKSSQDDKYKKGFEKNEKAVLGGLLYKSESSSFAKKEGQQGMIERETKASFLGGMIKFENSNFDYKINGKLQETGTKTDIYVLGKRIENDYIKGLLNSSTLDGTYKTDLEKVESFVNKVKEITSSVSSYFNKDDKLEYKKITSETKGVKQDEMKVVELSKVDENKTAVSVSSYSKSTKKDDYSLDRTETRVVDKDIEKVSKETHKLKDEMKLDKDVVKEDKKDNNVKREKSSDEELIKTTKAHIMDEASMSELKTGGELIQHMIDNNERLIMVGDTFQNKSIGAGEIYDRLLEKTSQNSAREDLTSINRQRNADEQTKKQVVKMTGREVREAYEILEKQGRFKEGSKEEFMEMGKGKMLENQDKNLIMFQKNEDVKVFNDSVREAKYGKEELSKAKTFETHQDKRFDGEKKHFADNYEKGDLITLKVKLASGKERISNYKVDGINVEKNQLLVSSDKKSFTIDLRKESKNIQNVYKVEQKSFLEGDKIMILKNDKQKDVMNGQIGTVKALDEKTGKITIDFDGKIKELNLKDDNSKKIDHAYGITITKAQGMTVDNAFAYMESSGGLTNFNSANVGGSRHRSYYELWTDIKEKLIASAEKLHIKETTLTKDEMKEFKEKDFKEFKDKENFIKGSDDVKNENTNSVKPDKSEDIKEFKLSDLDKKDDKSLNKEDNKDVKDSKEEKSSSIKDKEIKEDKSSSKELEKTDLKENQLSSKR